MHDGCLTLPIAVEVRNVGQTAARGLHIIASTFDGPELADRERFYTEHVEEYRKRMQHGLVLLPNEETKKEFNLKAAADQFAKTHTINVPIVIVSVIYGSTIEHEFFAQTGKGFIVARKIDGRSCGFGKENRMFNLNSMHISDAYGLGYAT
jgi:hypothetical protein